MKLISALLLGLLFTGCTHTPNTHSTNTPQTIYIHTAPATTLSPVCIQYTPHTDDDPEGITFEHWADRRDLDYAHGIWTDTATGLPIGYSAAEDDAIWNDPTCIPLP